MTTMSAAAYRQMPAPKRNKFGAKKAEADGITFASQKERDRYRLLKARQDRGEISHLELQPTFKLAIGLTPIKFDSGRQAVYRADFSYFDGQKRIVEDVKGFKTKEYKLKRAIVHAMHPAVRIVEV